MYYGNIKYNDIANGEGIRTSLFVSGCRIKCKNCFNPETWDFKYGNKFTIEVENEIIKSLTPNHISGLTILGGEPMEEENQKELLPFLKKIKKKHTNKTIWLYTGYYFEDLKPYGKKNIKCSSELLKCVDVLVDGCFNEALKDITLKFRGSSNQRIINLKNANDSI